MSSLRHANLSPNSQHLFDFAEFKDRIRSGLSKCMSHSTAHLKDEVSIPWNFYIKYIALMFYRARGRRSSLLAGLLD